MPKIGRNQLCPCGSGKKFKRCHGLIAGQARFKPTPPPSLALAREIQRRRQQGDGKPIITAEAFGHRFVAVKNRLLKSKKWRTFPDFLGDYLPTAMGADWGNSELAKPFEKRHPILLWYHHLCLEQKKSQTVDGEIFSTEMTGAIAAYLHLAHDLFTMDHNAELQEKLIKRLKLPDNFDGARFEVFVAALLLRAGFSIALEDEGDRSRTHCEFTATSKQTGKKFSVEAKCRSGNKFRLGRQLNRALAKRADHERLVFIEMNEPDNAPDKALPGLIRDTLHSIRRLETTVVNGKTLPPAYVVVTNTPRHHHLSATRFRCFALAEGFQIADFKHDAGFGTIRAAIDARERHIEMHNLLKSMKMHSELPQTFDGEIPEFAFGDGPPRLLVGNRYLAKDTDGQDHPGVLLSGTVVEGEKVAYCQFSLPTGKNVINTIPLTAAELEAWKKYPDTFFGIPEEPTRQMADALDWYDLLIATYKSTSKEKLLGFMAASSDLIALKKLDQAALAKIYAERMAMSLFLKTSKPTVSPNRP